MQALLLVAHGSRRVASNDEVREVARNLAKIAMDKFDLVESAFLELALPNIRAGVDRCVEAGATSVTVVPYFLSAGRHVTKDVLSELVKAQQKHPHVDIRQHDYLGKHEQIPQLLLQLANSGGMQLPEAV